jgi:hypothetical protein
MLQTLLIKKIETVILRGGFAWFYYNKTNKTKYVLGFGQENRVLSQSEVEKARKPSWAWFLVT